MNKKIYIVLSQTGTLFSRAIQMYTKDRYNHASLAFDGDLSVMYSFGRRKRYNFLDSGFVQENFSRGLYNFFPNAYCCILEIPVTDAEYEAMYRVVNLFCTNMDNYRYNLLGVFSYMVGIGMARRDHYFCSQFVSYILNKTSFWTCDPEFTRPMDFLNIPHKRIVYEGSVREFIDSHAHTLQFT